NNVTLRISKISIQRRLIPHDIGSLNRSTVPKVVECSRPAPDDANQRRTLVGALGVEFVADDARFIDGLAPGPALCSRAPDRQAEQDRYSRTMLESHPFRPHKNRGRSR